MSRRELTAEQKADAMRLKAEYEKAKAAAKSRGERFTQDLIAELCGWAGQSAVSQYTNGTIPLNLDAALRLSRALNVPVERFSPTLAKEAKSPRIEENTSTYVAKQAKIPLISWVQAGNWCEAVDLYSAGDAEDWVLCPETHSDSTYALRVTGESMFDPSGPRSFSDGDIIYVDPEREPENKSFVVVRQNGNNEATFKQLIIEGGEKMLKALNPSWPNRIIALTDDSVLCGVVIGKYTKY